MKNCTSCETEQHHSLRFMFVSGLTTILLVSGLGVEDRQKCLCEVPILLHVTFFLFLRILAKGEVYPSKQDHFMNWNNKFEVFFFFLLFLLTSYSKVPSLCISGCRSVCRTWKPTLKSDSK